MRVPQYATCTHTNTPHTHVPHLTTPPHPTTPPPPHPPQSAGIRIAGVTLNHSSNMIFLSQVAMFCLYGGCTTFAPAFSHKHTTESDAAISSQMMQHVFIGLFVFLGLGFLFIQNMRSAWQNVGYSLAIGVTTVEWSMLLLGFWESGKATRNGASYWAPIPLDGNYLLNSLYIAATILVSYGTLAGRVSFGQAYGVAFWETFFATANYIIAKELKVLDAGGTFFVHLFGGVFGLMVSMAISNKLTREVSNQSRSKEAGAFALVGLVVLFVMFPIFNTGNIYYLIADFAPATLFETTSLVFRGYFNTIMAMASSIAATFMVSKANSVSGSHLTFWQVQTAAIAGGAAVGATAPFLRNPYGALMLGAVAGIVSVWGQTVLTPALGKLRFHDASGVLAGHVLPAIIGAFASAIAAARVTTDQDFSASQVAALAYDGRNAKQQGGYQIAYAAVSLTMALVTGAFTGLLMNIFVYEPKLTTGADDNEEWEGLEGGVKTAANPVAHAAPAPAPAPVAAPAPAPAPAAPAPAPAAEPAATA